MNFKSAYIGFLDILGFSDLIEHNSHEHMVEIYETILENVFQEVPRMIGPSIQKIFDPIFDGKTFGISLKLQFLCPQLCLNR